jgi:hypothetical protein
MSIYASNYIVDELTGEAKLVKHLNKLRIDRNFTWGATGGWNKNGSKARKKKAHMKGSKKKIYKIFKRELSKSEIENS